MDGKTLCNSPVIYSKDEKKNAESQDAQEPKELSLQGRESAAAMSYLDPLYSGIVLARSTFKVIVSTLKFMDIIF